MRYETMVGRLRETGQKLTPQRLAIVRILAESSGHPSVEDVYDILKKDFPTMSLATVYRNVLLLKSLGEVLEIGFPDGRNRYDGLRPSPHPHVICLKCRKIIDPDLDTLGDMTQELSRETGFEIVTHRLDFFGYCGGCRKAPG